MKFPLLLSAFVVAVTCQPPTPTQGSYLIVHSPTGMIMSLTSAAPSLPLRIEQIIVPIAGNSKWNLTQMNSALGTSTIQTFQPITFPFANPLSPGAVVIGSVNQLSVLNITLGVTGLYSIKVLNTSLSFIPQSNVGLANILLQVASGNNDQLWKFIPANS